MRLSRNKARGAGAKRTADGGGSAVLRGDLLLVTVDASDFSAARGRSRSSRYLWLVGSLASEPVDVTASVAAKGSARTVRSAVLTAARKAGVKVETAIRADGHVLARLASKGDKQVRLVGIAARPGESRVVKLKEIRRDGKTHMAVHELSVLDDEGMSVQATAWTDAEAASPFDGLTRGSAVDLRVKGISMRGDAVRADVIVPDPARPASAPGKAQAPQGRPAA